MSNARRWPTTILGITVWMMAGAGGTAALTISANATPQAQVNSDAGVRHRHGLQGKSWTHDTRSQEATRWSTRPKAYGPAGKGLRSWTLPERADRSRVAARS